MTPYLHLHADKSTWITFYTTIAYMKTTGLSLYTEALLYTAVSFMH